MRNFVCTAVAIIGIMFCQTVETATGDIVVNVYSGSGSPGLVGPDADVEQFLSAGDYTFELVNNIAGHEYYHPDADFTAWSYHQPGSTWVTGYNFNFDDGNSENDTRSSPPYAGPDESGGGRWTAMSSALEAFDDAVAMNAVSRQVHISFDQTIGFYIADNVLSDNAGGVSVRISPSSVPEPATVGTLGFAGIGLLLLRRRRRQHH